MSLYYKRIKRFACDARENEHGICLYGECILFAEATLYSWWAPSVLVCAGNLTPDALKSDSRRRNARRRRGCVGRWVASGRLLLAMVLAISPNPPLFPNVCLFSCHDVLCSLFGCVLPTVFMTSNMQRIIFRSSCYAYGCESAFSVCSGIKTRNPAAHTQYVEQIPCSWIPGSNSSR